MAEDLSHEISFGIVPIALYARARYAFQADERNQLLGVLSDRLNIPADDQRSQAFLDTLEVEIGRYKLLKEAQKTAPTDAAVQKQIDELPQKVRALQNALEEMYPTDVRSLVEMGIQDKLGLGSVTVPRDLAEQDSEQYFLKVIESLKASSKAAKDFLNNLNRDLETLYNACLLAQDINNQPDPDDTPKKRTGPGRRKDSLRLMLATHVARAYYKHLEIKPTKTRGGPFYTVLTGCLHPVGLYPRQDLFNLMKEAIDLMWEVRE